MSDNFQILAFDTVTTGEAPGVVETALGWMKAEGIIDSTPTDCVLGESFGFRPGPNWSDVVEHPGNLRGFLTLWTNGVHAEARRVVCAFGELLTGFRTGVCPACGAEAEPQKDIVELAAAWYERRDSDLQCPICSTASRLEDWDFQPFWAFAEAAVTFWNWPPLSEKFIANLVTRLSVPRVRHVVGRL